MRKEPRCTTWFCVADTAFQYEVHFPTLCVSDFLSEIFLRLRFLVKLHLIGFDKFSVRLAIDAAVGVT